MSFLPNIVFMGTPDFAVPALSLLHQTGFQIRLVVTQPDRPKGRGRQLALSPVKEAALAAGLPLAQPTSVRTPEFIDVLRDLAPDFLVVVAYGQILPVTILNIPKLGALNIHGSLLPKFRGPAPIQWAMIRGEHTTGITTMLMDQGVDTGDILMSAVTEISMEDTADSLHDRLAHMGADLLIDTLTRMVSGTLFPTAQNHLQASYAPLLKKEDGRIDWYHSARQLDLFIRAMNPWPGAYCFLNDKRLKICKAHPLQAEPHPQPGTVLSGFADELRIATGDGALSVLEIQGASGKKLPIGEFLRGHAITPGMTFFNPNHHAGL